MSSRNYEYAKGTNYYFRPRILKFSQFNSMTLATLHIFHSLQTLNIEFNINKVRLFIFLFIFASVFTLPGSSRSARDDSSTYRERSRYGGGSRQRSRSRSPRRRYSPEPKSKSYKSPEHSSRHNRDYIVSKESEYLLFLLNINMNLEASNNRKKYPNFVMRFVI